jgi:hypothetical protein
VELELAGDTLMVSDLAVVGRAGHDGDPALKPGELAGRSHEVLADPDKGGVGGQSRGRCPVSARAGRP